MANKGSTNSLKPLFISTGLLTITTVVAVSYLALGSSSDIENEELASTPSLEHPLSSDFEDLPAELKNGLQQADLRSLLPKTSAEDDIPVQDRKPLSLWQPGQKAPLIGPDQLRVENVIANPDHLEQLEVGRKVEFVIPHTGEFVAGEISAQQLINNGMTSYDITLNSNNPLTSGHAVRGKNSTDFVVVTEKGNYTVSINNKTGAGQVIDDRDLNIYRKHPDTISVDTSTPPAPTS